VHPVPKPVDTGFGKFRLRCWPEESAISIEPVDLHENRTGFRRATPTQYGIAPFNHAAADIGRDEYIRTQAHRGIRES
jgi:hypothetical protein